MPKSATKLKFGLAGLIVVATSLLMFYEKISPTAGLVLIVGVATSLGVYEGGKRMKSLSKGGD